MEKRKLVETLEKTLQSMHEALDKNEGSTLQAVGNSIKLSYESFRAYLDSNETAKGLIENMKSTAADFETALKNGDKQLSASLLQKAEAMLAEYKAKD